MNKNAYTINVSRMPENIVEDIRNKYIRLGWSNPISGSALATSLKTTSLTLVWEGEGEPQFIPEYPLKEDPSYPFS